MVELVLREYVMCPPHRCIAVVTYTNEAAKEIGSRLDDVLRPTGNVFIGTIHSFLIRFILKPLGYVTDMIPQSVSYVDAAELPYKAKNRFAKRAAECRKAGELVAKGFVSFDKVLELSASIVSEPLYANAVARRLHAILVDEYQDARMLQHMALMSLFGTHQVQLNVVGDPMQSIFAFTYSTSQLKDEPQPETHDALPLMELAIRASEPGFSCVREQQNHRSVPAIVTLLNRLNPHLIQVSTREDNGTAVHFAQRDTVKEAVDVFLGLASKLTLPMYDGRLEKLILARNWSVLDEIPAELDVMRVDNEYTPSRATLKDAQRLVLGLLNLTPRTLREDDGIPPLELRKFVLRMFRDLRSGEFEDDRHRENYIRKRFESEFGIQLSKSLRGSIGVSRTLHRLLRIETSESSEEKEVTFSTIHTAKGLEAQSVLVIAKTRDALATWLQLEKAGNSQSLDQRNLGFVAFSRARDFLCVACTQDVGSLEDHIIELGLEIV